MESALAASVSRLGEDLLDRCAALKTALDTMPKTLDAEGEMHYCHDQLVPAMGKVRETIDHMETLVASSYWPVPTYCDLLFSGIWKANAFRRNGLRLDCGRETLRGKHRNPRRYSSAGDFFYFVCAARKPSMAAICMAVCSGAGPP